MDHDSRLLPIPLWVEYTRIKQELEAQRSNLTTPMLDMSEESIGPSRLSMGRMGEKKGERKMMRHTSKLSISLSPEETAIGPKLPQYQAPRAPSPLKQSILSLKKSVLDMKQSSKDLYKSISQLSTSGSFSISTTGTTLKSSVYSRMALMSRGVMEGNYRQDVSPRMWMSTDDKSIQVDPPHALNPNETLESIGKLSFSQLAESAKKDPLPHSTLLVTDSELSRVESHQSLPEDNSPRSVVQQSRAERETRRHQTITTPLKPKPVGAQLKRSDTFSPMVTGKRTMNCDLGSPSSDRNKAAVYYLKVINFNGRYYPTDGSGLELVLGKPTVQGISLKGKETTGGFHLFTSAQEAMNQGTKMMAFSKKGSRIGLMKVFASGPSLRYLSLSISDQEVVYTSVIPQDVMPMIAANVLVGHGSAGKKKN